MASANTNKTIFSLGVVGVLIFLAWKLWPAISKKLSGGGGGASQVGSDMGANQYPGSQQQQQPQGSGFGAGINGGNPPPSSGSGVSGFLQRFLNAVNDEGTAAATALGDTGYDQTQIQANNDFLSSLQQVPVQDLTNLPSYSYDDPNAPWNSGGSTDQLSYTDPGSSASYSGDSGGADSYDSAAYSGGDGGDGGDSGD